MPNRKYVLGTLVIVAGIVYVSLYPFHWHLPHSGGGPLHELARSWDRWPESHGDFIANLLLYLPWGFFCVRSLGRAKPAWLRIMVATGISTALSLTMEIAQFYIAERYTDMRDVYANVAGAALGAIAGIAPTGTSRMNILRALHIEPFPALLLGAFLAARLYPFVPVISVHKYVAALRPLFDAAYFSRTDLFFAAVIWLVICYLAETLFGKRAAFLGALLVAAVVFGGEIVVSGARLSPPSVLGAALALVVWFGGLRFLPGRVAIIAVALAAVIMIGRLAPFRLSPVGHQFQWMPFLALLRGPIDFALPAMIEKFFLYGGLIWLLMRAGMLLWHATGAVTLLLLFSSVVEIYLPGRTAGITDTLLALLIGTLLYLTLPPREGRARESQPA